MKATGIVRRIDDLGRVVIPKEIRRTLRIREGDPLEIFVDRDGEVILKKYSPIGELGDFAVEYADALHEVTGHIVLVTDEDAVIAVAGAPKREYMDKRIGEGTEAVMESGNLMWVSDVPNNPDYRGPLVGLDDDTHKYSSVLVAPIMSVGDPIGTVIMCSRKKDVSVSEVDMKLAETAASFLGRQMEE